MPLGGALWEELSERSSDVVGIGSQNPAGVGDSPTSKHFSGHLDPYGEALRLIFFSRKGTKLLTAPVLRRLAEHGEIT